MYVPQLYIEDGYTGRMSQACWNSSATESIFALGRKSVQRGQNHTSGFAQLFSLDSNLKW